MPTSNVSSRSDPRPTHARTRKHPHQAWIWSSVALTVALLTGCHEQQSIDGQSVYRFAWWMGPTLIGCSLLALPLGHLLRRLSSKWGWVMMIMSGVILLLVVPSMFLDGVVISDTEFRTRHGLWFQPTVHHIQFGDLEGIETVTTRDTNGKEKRELKCYFKRKPAVSIPCGDLIRHAVPEILARAKQAGVPRGRP